MHVLRVVLAALVLGGCSTGDLGASDPNSSSDSDAGDNDGGSADDGGAASDPPIAPDMELACFDSYCPHQALAKVPLQLVSNAGTAAYRAAMHERIFGDGGYLTQIQSIYDSDLKYHSTDEWNYYNRIVGKQDWESPLITSYVALGCHKAFVQFADAEVAAGRPRPNPDALDWTTLPDCKAAGAWLEKAYDAWFTYQHMDHGPEPALGGFVPKEWDPYGVWPDNGQFNPVRQWFSGSAWFYPLARYTHLVSNEFLDRARTRTMAALCGLKVGSSNVETYDFQADTAASTGAQWLLLVDSWVQMTTTLLRAEKRLGLSAAKTDCATAGTFSSADALAITEKLTKNTRAYVEQFGQTEYQSSYGHVILDSIIQSMTTASSQAVYDDMAAVYRAAMWDVAANFSPSAGNPTGPGNRNHDLFLGSHGAWMNFEIPLYVQPFFHPFCDALGSCVKETPPAEIPKVSAPSALPYFRTLLAIWQLGGYSPSPYSDVRAIVVDRPVRMNVQNAGRSTGMDRQQFVTPTYSLGHAGDDTSLIAINYHLTARLGGAPNSAQPITPDLVSHSTEPDTFVTGEIRHMLVSEDDPFRVDSTSKLLPGLGLQITPRQVVAQHQSFMLVTQLAAPGSESNTNYGPFDRPLSTNLLFPLAVDEIFADGAPLPRDKGAAVALPDGAMLTLRHHDASLVIRPIVVERSSGFSAPTARADVPLVAPGSGTESYAVQWQVDDSSYNVGYGKVVYSHKRASDTVNRPYHVAFLWAAGVTRTEEERKALETLVHDAPIKENALTPKGRWTDTGFDGTAPDLMPPGSCTWALEVTLAGHALRVDREDVYQPWGNDPSYRTFDGTPPFYTKFSRTFDGLPTVPPTWSATDVDAFVTRTKAVGVGRAYWSIGYADDAYWQPHL